MMEFKIAVAVGVYLFSVIYNYNWMKKAFSKGGRFQHSKADFMSIVFTITPIWNTLFILISALYSIDYNKFFDVKK
mgnify:CR=1 FL=1